MTTCPLCKSDAVAKAIWMGFPIKMCISDECSCIWGFWSFLPMVIPFDGWFFVYEGSYLAALWTWLFGDLK